MYGTLIGSVSASGSVTSLSITGIPQNYTDLILVFSTRSAEAAAVSGQYIRFNSDSVGANYSYKALQGTGSSVVGSGGTYGVLGYGNGATSTASIFSNGQVHIFNYAGSTNKVFMADHIEENNAAGAYQNQIAGLWSNTAAITSISINFADQGQNTVQYSTAYLYGLSNGNGKATVTVA